MTRKEINRYFMPDFSGTFWRWSEGMETASWWNGETIAFHEEVETVIRRLSRFGLPGFSEIVLVLGACRKNWNAPGGGKVIFLEFLQTLETNPVDDEGTIVWVKRLLTGLDQVNRHAGENPILERKVSIMEALFEDCGSFISPSEAAEIALGLRYNNVNFTGLEKGNEDPMASFALVLKSLLSVLPRLEEITSLETRELTGLDHLPEPVEELAEDISHAEAVRSLIFDLSREEESELIGLADVARDLLGILNVPRELSDPEEMPMGGFSDIANQGDLDKLLLTELAQDDEILAVRVALNEALYLRRESPPKNPPRRRRIMIDNGIRLWGIPRAFAHSAALALAANADHHDSIEVFSTDFDSQNKNPDVLVENDFRSEEGLIDALTRLDPSPHAAARVVDFLENDDAGENTACDHILITHPNVLADPEFRQLTRKAADKVPFFVVTVNELGELEFLARTGNGERSLQRIQLDLDKITREGKKNRLRPKSRKLPIDPSLPTILAFEQFPLLLAHSLVEKKTWSSENGDVVTLSRGLLFHYERRDRGARLIHDSLVAKGHCLLAAFEDDQLIFSFGESTEPRSIVVDLETGESIVHRYSFSQPARFAMYLGGAVVFFTRKEAIAVDPFTGEEEHRIELKSKPHLARGRFVQCGSTWFAVSFGSGISMTPIAIDQPSWINYVFDCPLFSVPLVVMRDGRVYQCDGDKNPIVGFTDIEVQALSVLGVIDNGRRLYFRSYDAYREVWVYDFEKLERYQGFYPMKDQIVRDQESRIPSLRKKIAGLRIGEFSDLGLLPKSGGKEMVIQRKNDFLRLVESDGESTGHDFYFRATASPATGYKLSKVEFPGGSSAFLDSRGMLHLKSNDGSIPEITFILKDGPRLSGWMSTGEYFGESYFIGDHPSVSIDEVEAHLLNFVFAIRNFLEPV